MTNDYWANSVELHLSLLSLIDGVFPTYHKTLVLYGKLLRFCQAYIAQRTKTHLSLSFG